MMGQDRAVQHQLEKWIARLSQLPVVEMLLPGLEPAYIRSELSRIGLDCCGDVVEMYSFCGGVKAPEGTLLKHMRMYGSHYLRPFDRAVQDYEIFSRDPRWDASWFPILGNSGGDFYSVCSLMSRNDWGQISYFMINTGEEAHIEFSSILNMLTVINECFDREICFVGDQGVLETKYFDASIVAMNHNRHLPYYQ